jgi:hypothetical protein
MSKSWRLSLLLKHLLSSQSFDEPVACAPKHSAISSLKCNNRERSSRLTTATSLSRQLTALPFPDLFRVIGKRKREAPHTHVPRYFVPIRSPIDFPANSTIHYRDHAQLGTYFTRPVDTRLLAAQDGTPFWKCISNIFCEFCIDGRRAIVVLVVVSMTSPACPT